MQRQQSISLLEFVQCLGVSSESLYNLIELNLGQQSVIDWSNPQTLYILHKVLQEIESVKQCLQLMDWVQHKYLRYLCASLLFFCLSSHISSVLLCAFVPLNIDLVKIKPMTHLDVKLVVGCVFQPRCQNMQMSILNGQ